MTQKKSSKEDDEIVLAVEPEIEVIIEDEEPKAPDEAKAEEETPSIEVDVESLRQQIADLEKAQELSRERTLQAQRAAQDAATKVHSYKQDAENSQYESILTALGAQQNEVDTAKRDIVLAGNAQDYVSLADAQERLSAAKANMIGLEHSKNNYEQYQKQQQNQPVETNSLSYEERNWLDKHPDAVATKRNSDRLNVAYMDAMDKGLPRSSPEYFAFLEERLGFSKPQPTPEVKVKEPEESSVMVAAPPSNSVPSGSGTGAGKGKYTLNKEEAEIARLSGITPQEYVKQREIFKGNRKAHPDDYPDR